MPLPQCQHCPGEVWEPECSKDLFLHAKPPLLWGQVGWLTTLSLPCKSKGWKEGFRGGLGAAVVVWDGYKEEMTGQGEVQGVGGYCLAKTFSNPC